MATWSGIRKRLERDYLAECLRGRIQYFATTYRESHDQEGRAAILLDGKEVISGGYYKNWTVSHLFPKDDKYEKRISLEFAFIDDTALKLGVFDQRCFYCAFSEFDNQSIEKSLRSEDLIVRIFAILDRRVGKRKLITMKNGISEEPEVFQRFYEIRSKAEGLS